MPGQVWRRAEYGFGRELSDCLSAYYLCAKLNSPIFSQSSPSSPQNSVSSPRRNSILETEFRPFLAEQSHDRCVVLARGILEHAAAAGAAAESQMVKFWGRLCRQGRRQTHRPFPVQAPACRCEERAIFVYFRYFFVFFGPSPGWGISKVVRMFFVSPGLRGF